MKVQLTVVRDRGLPEVLVLEAASIAAAREQCLSSGYVVLTARPSSWLPVHIALLQPASGRLDVLVFAEQLRDLLVAGLGVVEALSTLNAGGQEVARSAARSLLERLRGGDPLSVALASDPQFPPLLVALVRASEWTSDLPQALTRYLEHELRVRALRHNVSSAVIYPLLLVCVGSAVLLFLLFFVVPRFARVFEGMSGDLPWSARAMVEWSSVLSGHGPLLLTIAAAVVLVAAVSLTSPAFRAHVLARVFRCAPVDRRLRTYFLARWFRATGMLVEGGIPLPDALGLSAGLLPHSLRAGGVAVERAIRDGLAPTDAHARAGMLTPVAEQLMRAGERTGDLGSTLGRIAQFHDTEIARTLERTLRILEPLIMVLVGAGIGAVVILMYLPIFELASAIE